MNTQQAVMTTAIQGTARPTVPTAKSLTARQAALLQLAPGIASLPVFAIIAGVLAGKGIPNMFALGLTILLIEVPVTWAIMVRHVRRETGNSFSFAKAFPWSASIPWWQYPLIGLPVIIFSMLMIVGVGPRIEAVILHSAFTWVPDWFVMRPDPSMFAELSRELLLALWGLMFVAMVVVGGATQELFARGFLLPRTEHLGNWAPAFNALLFSIAHLIAPWSWTSFFLMTLPWAYLVWWRRSVKIGLFVHVGMLALQWLGLTFVVFGLVPAPA